MGQGIAADLIGVDSSRLIYEAMRISQDTVLNNCVPVKYEIGDLSFIEEMAASGKTKHSAVWFRDAFMRRNGLMRIGKEHVVGNMVRAALNLQKNGMIPRRLADEDNYARNVKLMLGLPKRRKMDMHPEYMTAGGWLNGEPVNPQDIYFLTLAAAGTYVKETGHIEFALDHMGELDRTLECARSNAHNGMVERRQHGCWNDHDPYEGKSALLTLHKIEAWCLMAELKEACSEIGPEYAYDASELKEEMRDMQRTFNQSFWDEELGYYVKGVEPLRSQFSIAENSLAILLGIADTHQRERIVQKFKEVYDAYGYMPIHTPGFSVWEMALLRIPFAHHYATGKVCLPWNQALAAEAIALVDERFAEQILTPLARSIVQHGNAEVLKADYSPYRPPYMSGFEEYFTWGALGFIEAAHAIRQAREEKQDLVMRIKAA